MRVGLSNFTIFAEETHILWFVGTNYLAVVDSISLAITQAKLSSVWDILIWIYALSSWLDG